MRNGTLDIAALNLLLEPVHAAAKIVALAPQALHERRALRIGIRLLLQLGDLRGQGLVALPFGGQVLVNLGVHDRAGRYVIGG